MTLSICRGTECKAGLGIVRYTFGYASATVPSLAVCRSIRVSGKLLSLHQPDGKLDKIWFPRSAFSRKLTSRKALHNLGVTYKANVQHVAQAAGCGTEVFEPLVASVHAVWR